MTEMNVGTVYIAIDVLLDSDSGRAKHTDVDHQGGWLFHAAAAAIEKMTEGSQGAAVAELRYYGTRIPPEAPVLLTHQIGTEGQATRPT
jgi:hypothetical protein